MLEVLTGKQFHKYLGRKRPGNLAVRTSTEVAARMQSAWAKFHRHRDELTDKQVSLRARLKLFDTVVTPSMLFGFGTCPLSAVQLQQLDVLQRRMMRIIAGWTRYNGEDWSQTMRRIRGKVHNALRLHPMPPWSEQWAKRLFHMAAKVAEQEGAWPHNVCVWDVPATIDARRSAGRPRLRWDKLEQFAVQTFGRSWLEAARNRYLWIAAEGDFVEYVAHTKSQSLL